MMSTVSRPSISISSSGLNRCSMRRYSSSLSSSLITVGLPQSVHADPFEIVVTVLDTTLNDYTRSPHVVSGASKVCVVVLEDAADQTV